MDFPLSDSSGARQDPKEPLGPLEHALRFGQRVEWFGINFRVNAMRAGWEPATLVYDLCPCCAYPKLYVGNPKVNCFLCRLGVEKNLESFSHLGEIKYQIQQGYDALIREKDWERLKILWAAVRTQHGELESLVPEEYRFYL